jgi:hypothetical protein
MPHAAQPTRVPVRERLRDCGAAERERVRELRVEDDVGRGEVATIVSYFAVILQCGIFCTGWGREDVRLVDGAPHLRGFAILRTKSRKADMGLW